MIDLNMIYFCIAACYICDISGVMPKLARFLHRILFGKSAENGLFTIPLISCSKCVVFWGILIISFFKKDFILLESVGLASLCSLFSFFITKGMQFIITVGDIAFDKLLNKINNESE